MGWQPSGGSSGGGSGGFSTVSSISADPAPGITSTLYLYNAAANPSPFTLPTASGVATKQIGVKKVDSTANEVTIGTTSGQTIDGFSDYILEGVDEMVVFTSDGSNWQVTG